MKIVGIYGSPRQGGNSERLLDETLKAVENKGANVVRIKAADLQISGCMECGGCDKTGQCVIKDCMRMVYPHLTEARAIVLATPIFFYSVPAQAKALIDRCQAMWSSRMLNKTTPEERKRYDSGRGYMIGVGATKGENLFTGVELVAKYFYDALDMSYEGGVFVKGVDAKGAINERPESIKEANDLGVRIVGEISGEA
jgi:multimeric flavodoxin WrbA